MVEMIKHLFTGKRHVTEKHKKTRHPIQSFMDSVAEGYAINLMDDISSGNL